MSQIDNNFPFNGFRKQTYKLSRLQAILMVQIRCSPIPFNIYLHRINRSDTKPCQLCFKAEDNLQNCETVKHYLFKCPSLSQEREDLVTKIVWSHLNIRNIICNIIHNTDYMFALATFINRTGRFKEKHHTYNQPNPTLGQLPTYVQQNCMLIDSHTIWQQNLSTEEAAQPLYLSIRESKSNFITAYHSIINQTNVLCLCL